ncbi:MAG TPA: 7-cyano-7-deazaguanine synthase [Vicinamibacterales bacterium]|nr:7-cyano-7-deazaguanine synthase [Vicinamibacterales bacterium]
METLVLLSGGLDSAVLLAHEARGARVHPLYVSAGLSWEPLERAMVEQLLASSTFHGAVEPLASVEFSMRDVYAADHWAVRGTPPAYDTRDEDVYLPGRNLVLLTKAGVVAAARNLSRIALGPLAGNPFPDATPEFFAAMQRTLTLGLDHAVEISTPFSAMHKEDVIRIGKELGVPFELTLSCMNPVSAGGVPLHCGLCSKCRERRDAFRAAGVEDPTRYGNR